MPSPLRLLACLTSGVLLFTANPSVRSDDPWLVLEGKEGPGRGKSIVLVSGDDEYRSEEGLPMLAKILAERHGFNCTVLFAIDPADGTVKPNHQTNIPGTEALHKADLMVLFTRFRNLPDEQMKPIVDFSNSGKPMIGLRTATHPFNYPKNSTSPYARFTWTSQDPLGGFGQLVFGDTWVSHHGKHKSESARGVINPDQAGHPILRGVTDVWGPSDVYGITHLPAEAQVLLRGQILTGMKPTDPPVADDRNHPMMPLAWTREYQGESGRSSRVFFTTMGAAVDLESAGLRRLIINAVYWGLGLEDQIAADANVAYVGEYRPTFFGFGTHQPGKKPADFR